MGGHTADGQGQTTGLAGGETAAADGAALQLIELRRRYGDRAALDGLSFGVPAGQVFGFLGPNGAGKTTAMRAIVGVLALDGGEVRWRGGPVGAEARRAFGYMPEERGLYPGMTVLEQLEYLGRLYGMSAADARASTLRWTDRLGVADKRPDKIETLSQGNQQRIQLAAALVHDPDLLVLDEPFAGLDPAGVDEMSEVLTERAAEGATVLFSSHQLDLVQDICEAVAIIHRGRLVAEGGLDELRRGGEPRLSVRVAGDPEGRWAGDLPAAAGIRGVKAGTVSVTLAPGADAQLVLDVARAAGAVEHFSVDRRRLSDVFREAVAARPDEAEPGDEAPADSNARGERP